MANFKSGWDFIVFEGAVRNRFRYVHSDEVREFLGTMVKTSGQRLKVLPERYPLWRAQRGCDVKDREQHIEDADFDRLVVETEIPHPPERMKPRRNAAHEGRVNSKGIPCLYLATDRDTAMAEVRPWLGAKISLGDFETTRQLRVIDFAVHHDKPPDRDVLLRDDLPPERVTEGIWAMLDRAFSTPVSEDPSTAEYVPTQIIAEMFRCEGFDGIYYKSRLGPGFNVALFDLDSADLVSASLFRATKLEYGFTEERQD